MVKLLQCCRFVQEGRWNMNGVMNWPPKTQVGLVEVLMLNFVDVADKCMRRVMIRGRTAPLRIECERWEGLER